MTCFGLLEYTKQITLNIKKWRLTMFFDFVKEQMARIYSGIRNLISNRKRLPKEDIHPQARLAFALLCEMYRCTSRFAE